MVARKRTKKAETPAAETIIEASDSVVAGIVASVAASIRGAYLPVWLCAALCLSAVALGLAGWPYLHKVLNPQPSTPWAADIAAAQAGFDSQIGALETRIATLDSQLAQFAENSETASADRTEQAARLAQIASQLDALDTQLAALRQPPPASKQPSADRAVQTSPPSSDERTDQPTQAARNRHARNVISVQSRRVFQPDTGTCNRLDVRAGRYVFLCHYHHPVIT